METIIQAINKAMTQGVYNLDEAAAILKSIDEVVAKVKCANDCETKKEA